MGDMEAEMTDEQINAAIAEACGWTDIHDDPTWGWLGRPPKSSGSGWPILLYTECLNAMHKAESVLTDDQYGLFSDYLYDTECKRQVQAKRWRWLSATARQRAEAFLRAIGRWEE